MQFSATLVFYVNGKKIVEKEPDPTESLLTYLRENLLLRGSKLGCGEGGCGACTVSVAKCDHDTKQIRHYSVNACLLPVCSLHGLSITTVEGIGNVKNIHPIQERLALSHGTQCGFCTPGFVMSMYTLLRNTPHPSKEQIEHALEGNLCRCTGYRPILDGLGTFSKDSGGCPMGANCCKNQPRKEENTSKNLPLYATNNFKQLRVDQELIFPSELQINTVYSSELLRFENDGVTFYRPTTIAQLKELKLQHPGAKLFVGNSEVGIEMRFKNQKYPCLLNTSCVRELLELTVEDGGVTVGASVPLSDVDEFLKKQIKLLPEYQTRTLKAMREMLKYFAGIQIRNVASVAGNIMTASPISDLNPVLLACEAKLTVETQDGVKVVPMDSHFFTGYRRTTLASTDVIRSVTIPYTKENEHIYAFKQAQRKEDDIAIVNACIKACIDNDKVSDIVLVYGGLAATTAIASNTAKNIINRSWDEAMLTDALRSLSEEFSLPKNAPGGMVGYRQALCTSFFFKFFLQVKEKLKLAKHNVVTDIHNELFDDKHIDVEGVQIFEGRSDNKITAQELAEPTPKVDQLGHPLAHLSALKHTTGQAVYVDDIPKRKDELYLGFVLSTRPHARIVSVDTSAAMELPGVIGYVDHTDAPGIIDGTFYVDAVFAAGKALFQGHTIGGIVATSKKIAQEAAKIVKVTYEDLPHLITIQDAIKAESYLDKPFHIQKGDLSKALDEAQHIIEGEFKMGGQEHFYMETQVSLVVPQDDDEYEAYVSTQGPVDSQRGISQILAIPEHKITIRTKRLGGAFGGKETKPNLVLLPLAVAAHKYGRAIRCSLDRNEDIVMTASRHPMLAKYKIGCDADGKILGLDIEVFANCGISKDLSPAVIMRMIVSIDNSYEWKNFSLKCHMCKTNIASNTAFRAFGVPQGIAIMEDIIDAVAAGVKRSPEEVRELNMYKGAEPMPMGASIDHSNLIECYRQVKIDGNFENKKNEVDSFNREHRWKKQGISVVPVKYGLGIPLDSYNQGASLVHIYDDGSIQLHHAGVEMGQGLHTKMVQIASRVLDVPISKIHVVETSTACVPNGTPTCASYASDLHGEAVKRACMELNARLKHVKEENPKWTWEEIITHAYTTRVNLSAVGHFDDHPEMSFSETPGEGKVVVYCSYGACCTHVEIDCLTGDHKVLRTDIVMDVGQSLNPAIDIGQIEGAFIQGYGLFCLEEQRYSPDGYIFTQGPGMYKIPSVGNIPREFNVRLLKESYNEKAVYSSKAIGEPPLCLAISVLHAIKQAIYAARSDEGMEHKNTQTEAGYHFRLDSPSTAERIRMACEDRFTKLIKEGSTNNVQPWSVQP